MGTASAENAHVVGKLAENMASLGWAHACKHAPIAPAVKSVPAPPVSAPSVPAPPVLTAWPVPSFPAPSARAVELLSKVREFVNDKVTRLVRAHFSNLISSFMFLGAPY